VTAAEIEIVVRVVLAMSVVLGALLAVLFGLASGDDE
jgi:hypothetical protein